MKRERETLMAIILGLLILVSAVQTVQLAGIASNLNKMSVGISGAAVGSMASSGESYDQMMARMHGTTSTASDQTTPGLGGC